MERPPIGPLSDTERRLESIRRRIFDIEQSFAPFFQQVARPRPTEWTTDDIADLQAAADDIRESFHRAGQELYEMYAELLKAPTEAEIVKAGEERRARIAEKIRKSRERRQAEST